MNIAKLIKTLQTEIYKKRNDSELETCLSIILDKFSDNQFDGNYVELDIYIGKILLESLIQDLGTTIIYQKNKNYFIIIRLNPD